MFTPRRNLDYPEYSMYQQVTRNAESSPMEPAYEFYGKKVNYKQFKEKIDQAARAFTAAGIGQGDRITICMPNVPQALVCFYAVDRIGAVCNMVHPLSARDEITFYLNVSESKMILTVDMFCDKVEEALKKVDHPVTILVARMQDELPFPVNAGFLFKEGRKHLKHPSTDHAVLWTAFLRKGTENIGLPQIPFDRGRTSVILYSGGTSGTPKGICLTDLNLNALAMQCREIIPGHFGPGLSMLSCMPMFHGFGLGVNVHTALSYGLKCILMPSFNIKNYTEMLIKKRPNFIAGVPTIYEALLHMPNLQGVRLDFLQGMFCGGDSLSPELKKKVDSFLKEHGASIQVREGYGLTECVTASCLTPADDYRVGSIGLPFSDMLYDIVKPGTTQRLPRGEEGEIILCGPTVMLGYLNNPEETDKTLRKLEDGRTWLYTGDLGSMDEDGFVYFRQRIKRMIISNGYNIYPGQIENIIDSCPEVAYNCVIGVPDERRGQRVRAYIVLKDEYASGLKFESDLEYPAEIELKEKIMERLRQQVAGYALPKEIVFRKELPKTLVGKVAFRLLEAEAEKETSESRTA